MSNNAKVPKPTKLQVAAVLGAISAIVMDHKNPSVWGAAFASIFAAFTGGRKKQEPQEEKE